jgi:hypothetical protein
MLHVVVLEVQTARRNIEFFCDSVATHRLGKSANRFSIYGNGSI